MLETYSWNKFSYMHAQNKEKIVTMKNFDIKILC